MECPTRLPTVHNVLRANMAVAMGFALLALQDHTALLVLQYRLCVLQASIVNKALLFLRFVLQALNLLAQPLPVFNVRQVSTALRDPASVLQRIQCMPW